MVDVVTHAWWNRRYHEIDYRQKTSFSTFAWRIARVLGYETPNEKAGRATALVLKRAYSAEDAPRRLEVIKENKLYVNKHLYNTNNYRWTENFEKALVSKELGEVIYQLWRNTPPRTADY